MLTLIYHDPVLPCGTQTAEPSPESPLPGADRYKGKIGLCLAAKAPDENI